MNKVVLLILFSIIIVGGCKQKECITPLDCYPQGLITEDVVYECVNGACIKSALPEMKAVGMNKAFCEGSGGKWNSCGSPCAGTGAEVCVEMCSEQCECGGLEGYICPDGYTCRTTGKPQEIGACIIA